MKTNQLIFTVLASFWLASHASSGQIEQQDINEIKPGITTETDLAHRFGPPDTRVVDTRGDRLLHWTKLGAPPLQGYIPIIGPWLGGRTYLGWIFGCRSEQTEESSITCAKFINADIALTRNCRLRFSFRQPRIQTCHLAVFSQKVLLGGKK